MHLIRSREHDGGRAVAAQALRDACRRCLVRRIGHHRHAHPPQCRHGLAEHTSGKQTAVAPGGRARYGEDLEVLGERAVLEPVVEDEGMGTTALDGDTACLVSAFTDHDRDAGELLGKEPGLIARLARGKPHAVPVRHHAHATRAPPVAAAENGRARPQVGEGGGHEGGEGCLAAASQREVADGDHGHGKPPRGEHAGRVAGVSRREGSPIGAGRDRQCAADQRPSLALPDTAEPELGRRAEFRHGPLPRGSAPPAPWSAAPRPDG